MARKLIILFSLVLILAGCEKNTQSVAEQSVIAASDHTHTSQNSLDWAGRYEGVLPCEDCEGIRTIIQLDQDGIYHLQTIYLGKAVGPLYETGDFRWSDSGNVIYLTGTNGEQRQLRVGENRLWQLDQEGNLISGEQADNYSLTKLAAEQVPATELTGVKWQLTELMGAVLAEESDIFLQFSEDFRFSGFAGCNHITGIYQVDGLRLSFSGIISTQKACMTETIEAGLLQVLQQVDNFAIQEQQLSLNRARMAPLARFTTIPE